MPSFNVIRSDAGSLANRGMELIIDEVTIDVGGKCRESAWRMIHVYYPLF